MNGGTIFDQVFTNNLGAVLVAGIFIFYLMKKEKVTQERHQMFNNIINNHLQHSNAIIKENSQAQVKLAKELQKLSDWIRKNSR